MSNPHRLTLSDLLEEHRRSRPDEPAVVDGTVRLTYADLGERVSLLAGALRENGVTEGERVLWLGQNSHRVLELLLACARLGAIFCPANWRQSADELAFVLTDLEPAVVVWETSDAAAAARKQAESEAFWVSTADYPAFLAGGSPAAASVDDRSPVLALYTGAFDGRPGAALLGHDALIAHSMTLLLMLRCGPGFTYLNSGPLFHVGTMMFCLATLQIGGKNVFLPAFDADAVARLIEAERCHHAMLFGHMIDAVVAANRNRRFDLSSLRFMSHSPEWDSMITVDDSPWNASRMGGFGQTEAAGMLTFLGLAVDGAGTAGRSSPLVQVRIVAPSGDEMPIGEAGEIVCRGKTLFSGYWNRPELTEAKLAGGWHHTGDLGRREADGTITFIGPKLRMIKSGNENIYPAEVERALLSHGAVDDAAVIGVPDETWKQAVKALVVLREGMSAREEDIISHVRGRIASYKKPRHVEFVAEIPKNGLQTDYDALDSTYGGGGYPGSAS